jgi:tRNA-binding protein
MSNQEIVYDDYAKVDIRIGRVSDVQPFPRARNPSYKVAVDLGEIGTKWSSVQITSYTPEFLVDRLVVCVVNLPPRNIAGFQSEVLILGTKNEKGDVIILTPESAVPIGQEVF